MPRPVAVAVAAMLAIAPAASESASFDVVIRGGTVYDGRAARRRADVASAATASRRSATSAAKART